METSNTGFKNWFCPQFDAWNIMEYHCKCMLLLLIHEIPIIHGIIIHNNPFQCETQISWIIMDGYYGNMSFTWILITFRCPQWLRQDSGLLHGLRQRCIVEFQFHRAGRASASSTCFGTGKKLLWRNLKKGISHQIFAYFPGENPDQPRCFYFGMPR